MAYWFRKSGKPYVYVVYRKNGENVPLPRAKTKHLDGEEDHNIDAFTNQIALKYEGAMRKVTPENILGSDTELGQYVGAYLDYMRSRGKSEHTVTNHGRALERNVIPFFLEGENPLRDPAQWPGKSIRLLQALTDKGLSVSLIQQANVALRGFYTYLVEEGRIQTGVDIRLRNPVVIPQETPLTRIVEPDEILSFIASTDDVHLKLTALFGYFGSLRPQEIFALRKADLVAGTRAGELECCKTMKERDLYSRLAVNVHRQRIKNGRYTPPKAHSKGHVAIFDERAAKLLVEILKDIKDPLQPLFPHLPDWHMKLWVKVSPSGMTTKDLRRASLYFLGHKTKLNDLVSLMKHARHKKPETTMLYLRRPGENTGEWIDLDLDA